MWYIEKLAAPLSREKLRLSGNRLIGEASGVSFDINDMGIPLFGAKACSKEARIQEKHYKKINESYIENLAYPHTDEYTRYLDNRLLALAKQRNFGDVAELCCGNAEGLALLKGRLTHGLGVDISTEMLSEARKRLPQDLFYFAQADAVMLPLADSSFDSVIMLGGIHHIIDRKALFGEVRRILKPGGVFYWREPLSDNFIWKGLRSLIYRLSPSLDFDTERPLEFSRDSAALEESGLKLLNWQRCGFFAFALFMNSDILHFNKLFRFVPGIRAVVRAVATVDEALLKIFNKFGLLVIGSAVKREV